jgi:hypothetical protein
VIRSHLTAILFFSICSVIFWFKSNARAAYGVDWSPMRWWLTTSLITNYLSLTAWWSLVKVEDVWVAGVIWSICSLATTLALNTFYFGFNIRGLLALGLCSLSMLILKYD